MKSIDAINSSTIVMKNKGLLEATVDDETIILSIDTSKYYGMDSVASRIWSLLEKPISVHTIIATLLAEYEVSEDECQRNVTEFLEKLLEEKMLDFPDE